MRNYEIAGAAPRHARRIESSAASAEPTSRKAAAPCRRWPATKVRAAAFRTDRVQRDLPESDGLGSRRSSAAPRRSRFVSRTAPPSSTRFGNVTGGVRSPYRGRADEHLVWQLHRRILLPHRRPRSAVRSIAAEGTLPDARGVRPRRAGRCRETGRTAGLDQGRRRRSHRRSEERHRTLIACVSSTQRHA